MKAASSDYSNYERILKGEKLLESLEAYNARRARESSQLRIKDFDGLSESGRASKSTLLKAAAGTSDEHKKAIWNYKASQRNQEAKEYGKRHWRGHELDLNKVASGEVSPGRESSGGSWAAGSSERSLGRGGARGTQAPQMRLQEPERTEQPVVQPYPRHQRPTMPAQAQGHPYYGPMTDIRQLYPSHLPSPPRPLSFMPPPRPPLLQGPSLLPYSQPRAQQNQPPYQGDLGEPGYVGDASDHFSRLSFDERSRSRSGPRQQRDADAFAPPSRIGTLSGFRTPSYNGGLAQEEAGGSLPLR